MALIVYLLGIAVLALVIAVPIGRAAFLAAVCAALATIPVIVIDAVHQAGRVPADIARPSYDRWYIYLIGLIVVDFGIRLPISSALRTHVEPFHIPTSSMAPGIRIGDFIYVVKPGPGLGSLRNGDIVVFRSDDGTGVKVIKRVVGLPGDTLAMRDDRLVRNGNDVLEPYAEHVDQSREDDPTTLEQMRSWQTSAFAGQPPAGYRPDRHNWGPIVVAADSFFVLGDNRDNAYDSRYVGFMPASHIYGRPTVIYFSYDPLVPRALPALTAIRWGRVGRRIQCSAAGDDGLIPSCDTR